MRLSYFWQLMHEQFGAAYAESLAQDYVLEPLGSRSVRQALADGVPPKDVWHAVCDEFDLPARVR